MWLHVEQAAPHMTLARIRQRRPRCRQARHQPRPALLAWCGGWVRGWPHPLAAPQAPLQFAAGRSSVLLASQARAAKCAASTALLSAGGVN